MKTRHQFFFKNAADMREIESGSIALVVTSPPYPMIEMWDELFAASSEKVRKALRAGEGLEAFEGMNQILDRVWDEVYRVLMPGGFACINIGDATRTLDGLFMCYANHARITTYMTEIGFMPLPEIVWRKQSNAPNKFMGSGMLPAGAYVTQEHEYILILRKGGKRLMRSEAERVLRQSSAFFWEERNLLFSDVWTDLLGSRQQLADKEVRKRSAAFPFELPYRLINMYSLKGDTVLDPFFGIGTTMLAAMAAGRNSFGYELSEGFGQTIAKRTQTIIDVAGDRIRQRLENHLQFVDARQKAGKPIKHLNRHYQFPVITAQEKELIINQPLSLHPLPEKNAYEVRYDESPQPEFVGNPQVRRPETPPQKASKASKGKGKKYEQMTLF